ncbi:MAG: histidinol-phosphate transaminase [Acidobacteriota bacterium]|nr:histidinol-phosphate transaminase [Acidobacteriota bacterium]
MPQSLEAIKTRVRELRSYSLEAEQTRVKLNQNENPWDVPLEIKRETLRRISDRAWSRYPDFVPQRLHERLAEFSGWKPEGIIAGNGSNELIQALLLVTIGAGKRVLISEPTFALYRQITTVLSGEVVSVPLTSELTYDMKALSIAVTSANPAVIIICSPNNPTGCVVGQSDLVTLLQAAPGLVVVDEAYFEFSGQTVVPLLNQHRNLVVLRTFSKAMALAALRVGYLLAAPELVREVAKAVLPYNLNAISQTAAEVAIDMYESKLQPLVRSICAQRDRLFVELTSISGLAPVRSWGNFMVVRSQVEPSRVFNELLQRDILVRNVSKYPLLQDYFRVSVGTPEENDLLLEALREILK